MSGQERTRIDEARAEGGAGSPTRRRYSPAVRAVGAAVVLGVLAAIAVVLSSSPDPVDHEDSSAIVVPRGASEDGAILVGRSSAATTVTLYFDYMCPACRMFEEANGEELKGLVDEGVVNLELRPLRFLDRASLGTAYSTRAANALATVQNESPENVWAFHAAMYAHQPPENTSGLTDAQVATYAEAAGVPRSVTAKFGEGTYSAWVRDVSDAALASTVSSTPTILIDGKLWTGDPFSAGSLTRAIEVAAAKA